MWWRRAQVDDRVVQFATLARTASAVPSTHEGEFYMISS